MPLWFGQVDKDSTTLWGQFKGVNPNETDVEINVRQTVFTPEKTGINYNIHHCDQAGVVGSLGCAFSWVTDNVIHDIHTSDLFGGAEMGGIKFHGAIDVVISHNHIYRCGNVSAIWLDWMGQGAQVTRNLVHDNTGWAGDLFLEMQHGPLLVANNIFLSSPRIQAGLRWPGEADAKSGWLVSDDCAGGWLAQ